jgi:hypothetical protein
MTQECGSPHLQLGSSLSIEFAILSGYDWYPIEIITNNFDFIVVLGEALIHSCLVGQTKCKPLNLNLALNYETQQNYTGRMDNL